MTSTFIKNSRAQDIKEYTGLIYGSPFSNRETCNEKRILDALNIEIKDSFIDAGCGTGHLAGYMQRTYPNCRVWGIDFSPERIEEAKRRYSDVNFIVDDLLECRLKADHIAFFDVLEHFPEPRKLLDQCEGEIIGSVPLNFVGFEHYWIFRSKADVDDLLDPIWSVEEQGYVFFKC